MTDDPEGRGRTTSRELSGDQSLENVLLRPKTTLELALDAERGLPYSYRVADRRKRPICHVRSSNVITMDAEL